MAHNVWGWSAGADIRRRPFKNSHPFCKGCVWWAGIGEVDHSHCHNPFSPHQTTSKYGDAEYDYCHYFTKLKKSNKPIHQTPKGAGD